ncbi:MAG: hypothetical protein E6K86_06800 [Thaumarchaeota archaeon]|nr:MAG: hypothetical protein E6K86_06800 [Nitrososphaerota archaeon]
MRRVRERCAEGALDSPRTPSSSERARLSRTRWHKREHRTGIPTRTLRIVRIRPTCCLASERKIFFKACFLNTLANLAEKIPGADAGGIIEGLSAITGLDKRYLRPGLGFGGSCLPKDLRALAAYSKQHGVDPDILEAAERVNQRQPEWAVRQADRLLVENRGAGTSFQGEFG